MTSSCCQDTNAAIAAANAKFAAALAAGDAQAIANLYTADAIALPPVAGVGPIIGRDAIRGWFEATVTDRGYRWITLETACVTPTSDGAIEVGRFDIGPAEGDVGDTGWYSAHWLCEDGQWRIARDVITSSMQ